MIRKIKCYLVFTPFWYRLILFLIMPLVLIALQAAMAQRQTWNMAVSLNLTIALVLLEVEVFLDYWAFGAISTREGMQLTYLRTSPRGIKLLKTALGVNLVRQLFAGLIPMLLGFVCRLQMGEGFVSEYAAGSLAYILLGYIFLVTASTIARFFDGMMLNLAIASIALTIMMLVGIFMLSALPGMLAILVPLAVLASIASVGIAVYRVKEGYYDRAD